MAVYHVVPIKDGRYDWKVTKVNVGQKSRHKTKRTAVANAKQMGNRGDSLIMHREDGTVQGSKKL